MSAATEPWAPRGVLGPPAQHTSDVTTSAGTVATIVFGTWKLTVGRRYELIACCYGHTGTVAGDNFQFNLTASGTNTVVPSAKYKRIAAATGNLDGVVHVGWIDATVTETVTLSWTVNRQGSGTGTITVLGIAGNPQTLAVKDVGLV